MPPPPSRSRSRRSSHRETGLGGWLAALLVVAGCSGLQGAAPSATPVDFQAFAARLSGVGITVSGVVAGDAGCDDPDLVAAAIGWDGHGLDQVDPVRIRFLAFRNVAAWERHQADIGDCAAQFVTDPATFEQLEAPPLVLVGQGPWSPDFEAALRHVLDEAAGD